MDMDAAVTSRTNLKSHEDMLSDDFGTHRTFSSFRKSTLRSTRTINRCSSRIPLLHPYGPLRALVDITISIALIYTCIEVPIILAFNIDLHLGSTLGGLAFAVDLLLLIDVFLQFRTAYFDKYDRLRLVDDEYEIAKRYLCSWFFIDLLSSLPYQLMGDNIIFRLMRAIKILRLVKMWRMFNKFTKSIVSRRLKMIIRISKLLLSMMFFAHSSACIWYLLGRYYVSEPITWLDKAGLRELDEHEHVFKLYTFSWYWAVVTLFTTGYGDITATNTAEQWISSILILVGTVFTAYFIGTLTLLLTEGDKVRGYKLDKLEEAQAFCDHKKLPKELQRAILTHTRYYCDYNYVFNEDEVMSVLPTHLQREVNYYLCLKILKQIDIFESLNDLMLGLIATKVKSINCNEADWLYHKGHKTKEIFIVRTGLSMMEFHDHQKRPRELKRGDIFGLDSLLYSKHKTSVKTRTWSEFYVISVSDIVNILQSEYPASYMKRWRDITNKVRRDLFKERHVDLNRYQNDDADESTMHADNVARGLHSFLNADSVVGTIRTDHSTPLRTHHHAAIATIRGPVTTRADPQSEGAEAGLYQKGVFGSIRSKFSLGKGTKPPSMKEIEMDAPLSVQQLQLETVAEEKKLEQTADLKKDSKKKRKVNINITGNPEQNAAAAPAQAPKSWPSPFWLKRKNSKLRDNMIHKELKQRQRLYAEDSPSEMKNGRNSMGTGFTPQVKEEQTPSVGGHHEFYFNMKEPDDLASSDSDDDPGDIAPGLLYDFEPEPEPDADAPEPAMGGAFGAGHRDTLHTATSASTHRTSELLVGLGDVKHSNSVIRSPGRTTPKAVRPGKPAAAAKRRRGAGMKGMLKAGKNSNSSRSARNVVKAPPKAATGRLMKKKSSSTLLIPGTSALPSPEPVIATRSAPHAQGAISPYLNSTQQHYVYTKEMSPPMAMLSDEDSGQYATIVESPGVDTSDVRNGAEPAEEAEDSDFDNTTSGGDTLRTDLDQLDFKMPMVDQEEESHDANGDTVTATASVEKV